MMNEPRRIPPIERFLKYVDLPLQMNRCWLWNGTKNRKGYGAFRMGKRCIPAYRFSYQHFIGQPKDGLVADHLCRTPSCVNPYHIEYVTQAENIHRSMPFRDPNNRRRLLRPKGAS